MMEMKKKYKMTELGEMPSNWDIKTIESISKKIVGGGTPYRKNNEFYIGKIPWVTVKDMKGDFYQGDSQEYINEDAIKKSAANLIEPGNVVIATRMALGRGFINTKSIAINQDLKAIYLNNDEIKNAYFLYWYLSNAKYIQSLGSGTTVKGLRVEQLIKLRLPIPPLKEQQKIAEILSTVDEQIEQTDQLIERTKELKKGLMQQLLTKGIGHTEFKQSEIGEIPVEWDLKKIGEICTFSQGLQVPVEEQYDDDGDDKVQFLRIVDYTQNNAQPRYIKKTEKKYFISKEDLIMIRYGNPGFVGIGREGVIANNMFKIIPEFGNITTRYLYIYLSQKNIKLKIKKMSTSTTMPAISFKTIADLPIVIPTINEQQKIAEIISSVDEDIEGYEEEKLKYEELKKGLMQQLLTGKTRVKVD